MPTQVKVLPITDRAHEYAKNVEDMADARSLPSDYCWLYCNGVCPGSSANGEFVE